MRALLQDCDLGLSAATIAEARDVTLTSTLTHALTTTVFLRNYHYHYQYDPI